MTEIFVIINMRHRFRKIYKHDSQDNSINFHTARD